MIEDTIVLEGLKFRFIDTAGIRETTDLVESIGIERSKAAMDKADIIIFLFDSEETYLENQQLASLLVPDKATLWVMNKMDIHPEIGEKILFQNPEMVSISAQKQQGLLTLTQRLIAMINRQAANDTVVTNLRHYEHLLKTQNALTDVLNGLATGVTGDFLAQDIRLSLHHLGEITGRLLRMICWIIFSRSFVSASNCCNVNK